MQKYHSIGLLIVLFLTQIGASVLAQPKNNSQKLTEISKSPVYLRRSNSSRSPVGSVREPPLRAPVYLCRSNSSFTRPVLKNSFAPDIPTLPGVPPMLSDIPSPSPNMPNAFDKDSRARPYPQIPSKTIPSLGFAENFRNFLLSPPFSPSLIRYMNSRSTNEQNDSNTTSTRKTTAEKPVKTPKKFEKPKLRSPSMILLEQGMNHFKNREYASAKDHFAQLSHIFSKNISVIIGYGTALFAVGDYDDAYHIFQKYIDSPNENLPGIFDYYQNKDDFQFHLEKLENHIQQNPEDEQAAALLIFILKFEIWLK